MSSQLRDMSGTPDKARVAVHPRGAGFRVLSRMARNVADEVSSTPRHRSGGPDHEPGAAATPEGHAAVSVDR
jgi:hypothetical protein